MPVKNRRKYFDSYHIAKKEAGPRVLLLAGIHGDEPEPVITLTQLAQELYPVLIKGAVTIVPVANRSAFKNDCRIGEDGLDLARTFPGNRKGTLTERVAFYLTKLIKQQDYLVDLHTGGKEFCIQPLSGYLIHANKYVLKKQEMLARCLNMPLIWAVPPDLNGRSLSVARDLNIPAVYAEYGGGTAPDYKIVTHYKSGCMNILYKLGMIGQAPVPTHKVKYYLKDETEKAGNLQTKMPAPAEGLFISYVNNNTIVEKNALFGCIINKSTFTKTLIRCPYRGLVFMTRATISVKKGSALGGIIPIK